MEEYTQKLNLTCFAPVTIL